MKLETKWSTEIEQDFIDEMQDIFCSVPKGNSEVKLDDKVIQKWKELGPLDVRKLLDDELITIAYSKRTLDDDELSTMIVPIQTPKTV